MNRRDFATALELAQEALMASPWTRLHWHCYAAALLQLRAQGDARLVYERILSIDPHDDRARKARGLLSKKGASREVAEVVGQMRDRGTLSACLIVKNEAARIGRCLQSLRGLVDEIVVVDTGSTDATCKIAENAGARVSAFEWSDHFSAARNASLERATGDWALVVDADEIFDMTTRGALMSHLSDQAAGAFNMRVDSMMDDGRFIHERVVRLFRRLPGARYEGRIHEQIVPSLKRLGVTGRDSDARFLHDGYTSSVVVEQDKVRRNERLLELALRETPDDAYMWFQLGKNHMCAKKFADAIEAFRRARAGVDVLAPYAKELWTNALRLFLATGDRASAAEWAYEAMELFPISPDVAFFAGQTSLEYGLIDEARESFTLVTSNAAQLVDPKLAQIAAEVLVRLPEPARAPAVPA